jgi:hypothetical protein
MTFATVFFILYAWICAIEARRGKRLFFALPRRAFDSVLMSLGESLHRKSIYIGRYMITLSWYYSLHTFLRLSLQFIAGIYNFIEAILHRNRDKARQIRKERKQAEKSHLTVLAEHKVKTELTPNQKAKRRAKALSGK